MAVSLTSPHKKGGAPPRTPRRSTRRTRPAPAPVALAGAPARRGGRRLAAGAGGRRPGAGPNIRRGRRRSRASECWAKTASTGGRRGRRRDAGAAGRPEARRGPVRDARGRGAPRAGAFVDGRWLLCTDVSGGGGSPSTIMGTVGD